MRTRILKKEWFFHMTCEATLVWFPSSLFISFEMFDLVLWKLPPGKLHQSYSPLLNPPPKISTWKIPTHVFKYSDPRFLSFLFINVTVITVAGQVWYICWFWMFLYLKLLMKNVMLLNSVNLI